MVWTECAEAVVTLDLGGGLPAGSGSRLSPAWRCIGRDGCLIGFVGGAALLVNLQQRRIH